MGGLVGKSKAKKREEPAFELQTNEKDANIAKSGPLVDRKCTDVICLGVYIAFQFVMLYGCVYAYTKGDPLRLTYPYDPDRKIF